MVKSWEFIKEQMSLVTSYVALEFDEFLHFIKAIRTQEREEFEAVFNKFVKKDSNPDVASNGDAVAEIDLVDVPVCLFTMGKLLQEQNYCKCVKQV